MRIGGLIIVALIIGAVVIGGCISSKSITPTPSGGSPENRERGQGSSVNVSTLPPGNLSQEEIEAILYMREEESLLAMYTLSCTT
ncbi:hypothetical protein [Pyrococcus sp. NA2]|uniref:hypothetical protein n=1 Tax=Pyrococcus sp. (strain NA2) TaxID=342949 RepID=UPI000AB46F2B